MFTDTETPVEKVPELKNSCLKFPLQMFFYQNKFIKIWSLKKNFCNFLKNIDEKYISPTNFQPGFHLHFNIFVNAHL